MNYPEMLNNLSAEFNLNFNLRIIDGRFMPATKDDKAFLNDFKRSIHSSLFEFYDQVNSYTLTWENSKELDSGLKGNVQIISSEKALSDWKDIVYFEPDSQLRFFKVLDQFASEACCGFYTTESTMAPSSEIFYFDFHDEPISLQIDIEGYIRMLLLSKGYLYWPKVLLDSQNKLETPELKLMRDSMQKIFHEFNFEEFINTYQTLIK